MISRGLIWGKTLGGVLTYCGWTKSISHHFEAMVETIICWYLQGIKSVQALFGGAGFRPSTVVGMVMNLGGSQPSQKVCSFAF